MIDETAEDVRVTDLIETRIGSTRMRFPSDPDTTQRLQNLKLDMESDVPRWRRILRWLRGEHG